MARNEMLFRHLDSLAHDVEAPKRKKIRNSDHMINFEDMKASAFRNA